MSSVKNAKKLAAAIAASGPKAGLRTRRGLVQSVAANGTITVTIGGGSNQVAGVKCLASFCPVVGSAVTLLTDGTDLFAVGALAPVANLRLLRSSTLSIPDSTNTAITWLTESYDNSNMFTSGTTATVVTPGLYALTASVVWPASTTGIRTLRILAGASVLAQDMRAPVNTAQGISLAWTAALAVGDALTVDVRQDTGGAINLSSASFGAVWLSP